MQIVHSFACHADVDLKFSFWKKVPLGIPSACFFQTPNHY